MAAYKTVENNVFGSHANDAQDFNASLVAMLRLSEQLDGSPPSGSNPYAAVVGRWRELGLPEFWLKEAERVLSDLRGRFDRGLVS